MLKILVKASDFHLKLVLNAKITGIFILFVCAKIATQCNKVAIIYNKNLAEQNIQPEKIAKSQSIAVVSKRFMSGKCFEVKDNMFQTFM